MRISSAFPSDYLKAADLDGRNVKVVISHVEMGDVGGDPKPVLFFQGKEKGMVLNKTNANNISIAYGDDTDNWAGKEIVLFEAMVDFQGRTVPAIRVRAPQAKDRVHGKVPPPVKQQQYVPQQTQARGQEQQTDDVDEDSVPF